MRSGSASILVLSISHVSALTQFMCGFWNVTSTRTCTAQVRHGRLDPSERYPSMVLLESKAVSLLKLKLSSITIPTPPLPFIHNLQPISTLLSPLATLNLSPLPNRRHRKHALLQPLPLQRLRQFSRRLQHILLRQHPRAPMHAQRPLTPRI
jgi:hypothetical protein